MIKYLELNEEGKIIKIAGVCKAKDFRRNELESE